MEFEKKLARLEEIVQKMEKGELTLEDSLKLFEEGVKLSKECQASLTDAENKVSLLTGVDANGTPVVEPFTQSEK